MNEETARQDFIDNVLIKHLMTEEQRLKKYGRCKECDEIKKTALWCNTCHFQKAFSTWTSGNKEIDYFIQNTQIHAWDDSLILEWYPWELSSEIEKIGQGGYGTVFCAKTKRGRISHWDYENNHWSRYKIDEGNDYIALKTIGYSESLKDFLNAVIYCLIDY